MGLIILIVVILLLFGGGIGGHYGGWGGPAYGSYIGNGGIGLGGLLLIVLAIMFLTGHL